MAEMGWGWSWGPAGEEVGSQRSTGLDAGRHWEALAGVWGFFFISAAG